MCNVLVACHVSLALYGCVQTSMVVGRWLLVEGVGTALDPSLLDAIAQHAAFRRQGGSGMSSPTHATTLSPRSPDANRSTMETTAGGLQEIHPGFQLFMTTRHWNPRFSPEVRGVLHPSPRGYFLCPTVASTQLRPPPSLPPCSRVLVMARCVARSRW